MPIFHLDIEAFLTNVERIKHPELNNRPLVIAPPKQRALVIAASPDAKKLGIRRDMPIAFVRKNFPGIHLVEPDFKLYASANHQVLQIVRSFSPIVEPLCYGHVAMDMTGMRTLFGTLENAAYKLCNELSERLCLQGTVGIAANKLVSTIAAKEVQKNREPLYHVPADEEPRFLGPLSCKALPEWDDKAVRKILFELNLRRIQQIQAIPRDLLSYAIGAHGTQLHRHAMGVDPSPVMPPRNTPQLISSHTFEQDTNDDAVLRATIYTLCESLCYQLRAKCLTTARTKIHLRYTDDVTRERVLKLLPTQEEQPIYRGLMRYFERLCDRRQRVRFLRLTFEGLNDQSHQSALFSPSKHSVLATHLDRIRSRFGKEAVSMGQGLKHTA